MRNMVAKLKTLFISIEHWFDIHHNTRNILSWIYILSVCILLLLKYRFSLFSPPAPGAPFCDIVICSASFYIVLRDNKTEDASSKIITIGLLVAVYIVIVGAIIYYYR